MFRHLLQGMVGKETQRTQPFLRWTSNFHAIVNPTHHHMPQGLLSLILSLQGSSSWTCWLFRVVHLCIISTCISSLLSQLHSHTLHIFQRFMSFICVLFLSISVLVIWSYFFGCLLVCSFIHSFSHFTILIKI